MPQLDTTVIEPPVLEPPTLEPEIGELIAPDFDLDADLEDDLDSDKPWHVVLLDDDHHTYAYVVEMLGDLFGYSTFKAYRMAREVDKKKRVIVWTGHLEVAESKQELIHDYGPDWRMTSDGSMSAILEQAR